MPGCQPLPCILTKDATFVWQANGTFTLGKGFCTAIGKTKK